MDKQDIISLCTAIADERIPFSKRLNYNRREQESMIGFNHGLTRAMNILIQRLAVSTEDIQDIVKVIQPMLRDFKEDGSINDGSREAT